MKKLLTSASLILGLSIASAVSAGSVEVKGITDLPRDPKEWRLYTHFTRAITHEPILMRQESCVTALRTIIGAYETLSFCLNVQSGKIINQNTLREMNER